MSEPTEPTPSDQTTPSARLSDDEWLIEQLRSDGVPVEAVVSRDQLTGGASRTTSMVEVRLAGEPDSRRFVLQEARPGLPGLGPVAEGAIATAAQAAGAPVPTVVSAGETETRSWIVTTAIDGETIARKILRDPVHEPVRSVFVDQAAKALAAIHRADITGLDLARGVDQLAHWRDMMDSVGGAHPVHELAFAHLERHRPPPVADHLVHGDFRLGNLILDSDGIAAVIDWELAFLGDPVADLGWLCCRAWRFGAAEPVAGMGSRRDLLAAYEAASGTTVDPDRLAWWELFGCLRWGIICMLQTSAHTTGAHRSVELAAIGRRVGETEYDILRHIAPEQLEASDEWEMAGNSDLAMSGAPHDDPPLADLVATVEDFLRDEVVPGDDRKVGFMARVAANCLATVGRQLELGPGQAQRHGHRLAAAGVTDDRHLAELIRAGDIDQQSALSVVVGAVVAKLQVANPRYASTPHTDVEPTA